MIDTVTRRLSCGRVDGVAAPWSHEDAIVANAPDAVRTGPKSKKRPPTACSPPDAIDATRKKFNGRRVPYLLLLLLLLLLVIITIFILLRLFILLVLVLGLGFSFLLDLVLL